MLTHSIRHVHEDLRSIETIEAHQKAVEPSSWSNTGSSFHPNAFAEQNKLAGVRPSLTHKATQKARTHVHSREQFLKKQQGQQSEGKESL